MKFLGVDWMLYCMCEMCVFMKWVFVVMGCYVVDN